MTVTRPKVRAMDLLIAIFSEQRRHGLFRPPVRSYFDRPLEREILF